MASAADRPLKKVTGSTWHKDQRVAILECQHTLTISPKEPMPYEARCLVCNPEEPAGDPPEAA